MARAVIAFGSNLGDRRQTLRSAAEAIRALTHTEWLAVSALYETAAVGPAQPDYLNAVGVVETQLGPAELLTELHRIEAEHERVRVEHWGPRTLDLDLVDYEGCQSDRIDLRVPHPLAKERAFVLVPFADVAPDWILEGISVAERAAVVDARDVTHFAGPGWWL